MNKKTKRLSQTALLIGTLAGAPPGWSIQQAGNDELLFSAGFFHSQGTDTGTLTADVGYGHYFTQALQVGVQQAVQYSFVDDADDVWTASTVPFVNYHFLGLNRDSTLQPFIGAFAGATYNDNDATGVMGPNVGLKAFVNDTTFIVVRYRYEWFFDRVEVGDRFSDGNHVVTAGIGYVF